MGRRKPDRSGARGKTSGPTRVFAGLNKDCPVVVGDDVLVATQDYPRPCAAKVRNVYVNKNGEGQLDIHWYWEPDHTKPKRQEWHAEKELFISGLKDTISVETVAWTCAVLPMEKYVAYLNFEADRNGAPHVTGPIAPDEHFNPAIDLQACKDLKHCKLPKEGANNSRKRKREGHVENTCVNTGVNGITNNRNAHPAASGAQQGANENKNTKQKENDSNAHAATAPAQAAAGHAQSDQREGEEADENQQNDQIKYSGSEKEDEEEGEEEDDDDDDGEDEEDWENQVFMCRGVGAGGEYDGAEEGFVSCHIPIYCKCGPPHNEQRGLPYNPDKSMVQCKECTDWFHYECKAMKLTQEEIDAIAAGRLYVCPVCKDSAGDINQAWTGQGDEDQFADET